MSTPAVPTQVLHKIQLLLARSPAATAEQFSAALRAFARRAGATGTHLRLALALPPAVMGLSTQGASGSGLPAIDAVLEVWESVAAPFSGLAGHLSGASDHLAGVLDLGRSCSLAGTEHIIMAGEGPVILYCPLRRLERLGRREFQDYWLYVHSEFGSFPGNRYRQFHCDEPATRSAALATGIGAGDFDGLAIAYFTDVGHLRDTLASPAISTDAYADEQRFIDHSRSQFLPFERVDCSGH